MIKKDYLKFIDDTFKFLQEYDQMTYDHSYRVGEYASVLGKLAGLNQNEQETLRLGGYLHDIGKTFVTPKIILKKDKLTESEYEEVKKHPQYGYEYIIKHISDIGIYNENKILSMILHHHERFDGNGYPDKVLPHTIYKETRILSICDTFDAITSVRCYKGEIKISEALDILNSVAGTQLDPILTKLFVEAVDSGEIQYIDRMENEILKKIIV